MAEYGRVRRRESLHKFYTGTKWEKCRAAYIAERRAIDGGLCEVCHEKPGKIVHHKVWLNECNVNDPDVSLNFDNLRFECQDCHNLEDNGPGSDNCKVRLPRLKFDADGNPFEIAGSNKGLKVEKTETRKASESKDREILPPQR